MNPSPYVLWNDYYLDTGKAISVPKIFVGLEVNISSIFEGKNL